ncbi:hydroxyisourate hydrolase [Ralstonia sp. 25C]|uniref:hydroxyisourate hydrolase n=1 Tax=Ralstonia sp. 25C TaxID=3447363 RepID=UPI003F74F332
MSFRHCILAAALTASSSLAMAQGRLSVHVLDQQTGTPAAAVRVTLEARTDGAWRTIGSGTTDTDGRIKALETGAQPFTTGDYRVTFHTGDYYSARHTPTFFPEVPVVFHVQDAGQHYHIPLLLSPFGFSTYRGS